MSLLKHTVLQSARKQWIAQKPTGLEGAVEDGKIEVMRRKSTSPSKAVVELSEDESDDERVEEEEEQMNRHAIPTYMAQPAREDGEGDEEEEEQAAAHKGDVEMQHGGSQQEYEQELAEEAGADVSLDLVSCQTCQADKQDEHGEEMQETANGAMHLDQSGTEDQGQYAQEMQEEDDYYEDEDMEGDFDEAALQPAAPATPQAVRLALFPLLYKVIVWEVYLGGLVIADITASPPVRLLHTPSPQHQQTRQSPLARRYRCPRLASCAIQYAYQSLGESRVQAWRTTDAGQDGDQDRIYRASRGRGRARARGW
jgi:hypothetical protein